MSFLLEEDAELRGQVARPRPCGREEVERGLPSGGSVVAFHVGLQGGECSDHFTFDWWSDTHFLSPETLNSTSSGPGLVSCVDNEKIKDPVPLPELAARLRG